MKREILEKMTDDELDQYAEMVGAKVDGLPREAAIDAALARANRTIKVSACGLGLEVDFRNVSNMATVEKAAQSADSIDDLVEVAVALLGNDQEQKVRDYVTDEDGRTDSYLYGLIVNSVANEVGEKN